MSMGNTTKKAHMRNPTSFTTGFEDREEEMWVLSASRPGVATGVVVSAAAAIDKETSFTIVKLEDVAKDVQEVGKSVKLLVQRERTVDIKTHVAIRRLERLEKETVQQDHQKHEAGLTEAFADKSKAAKLVFDKWFVDKGFGFGRVQTGETIFVNASVVQGGEVLMVGTDAWAQVESDDARAGVPRTKSLEAQGVDRRKGQEKAIKVAQQVRRAAALTAELAAQSEKKVTKVCEQPPGLQEDGGLAEPLRLSATLPQFFLQHCPSTAAECTKPLAAQLWLRARSRSARLRTPKQGHWQARAEADRPLKDEKEQVWEVYKRQ